MKKLYYFLVGYTSRPTYWSCSKFAKWCEEKSLMILTPDFAGHKEWKQIRRLQKQVAPKMYWFIHSFLPFAQDVCYFPKDWYMNVKAHIVNKYIDKLHVVQTGLVKGQYYDIDTRMLHASMKLLVDYVENVCRIKGTSVNGIGYLDWAIELGDESPDQAHCAKEAKEIYLWWKNTYNDSLQLHGEEYEKNTEMLIRLMKIRKSLW